MAHRNADNEADIQQFAQDLRQLRFDGGTPTYESLARATGLSRSIVAAAFSGNRLPSERTVHAVVTALGGDAKGWLERRARVEADDGVTQARELTGATAPESAESFDTPVDPASLGASASTDEARPESPVDSLAPQAPAPDGPKAVRTVRLRTALLVGVPATVVALAVGTVVGASVAPQPAAADTSARGTVAPATGENIFDTRCVDDGIVIASETRALETQFQVLLSYECNAVWSRVLRYDGAAYGNEISVSIFPKGQAGSPDAQTAVVQDAATAITTMIVQESVADEFCATASLTVDDETVDLGDPVCV